MKHFLHVFFVLLLCFSCAIGAMGQQPVNPIFKTASQQKKQTTKQLRTAKVPVFTMRGAIHRTYDAVEPEVLIDEDFSLLTKGTVEEQSNDDVISDYGRYDEEGNPMGYMVYPGKLHTEGWASFMCLEAGGALGLSYVTDQGPWGGVINSPEGDFSGDVTISLRVHLTKNSRNSKQHMVCVNLLKGGYDYPSEAFPGSSTFQFVKEEDANAEGWIPLVVEFHNTYGGSDCYLQINCQYDAVVIDDLKVTTLATTLATPTDPEFMDFTPSGFTAIWGKVNKADGYEIDCIGQRPTSDETGILYEEDFSALEVSADGMISGGVPEGWTLSLAATGGRQVAEPYQNGRALCFSSINDYVEISRGDGAFESLSFYARNNGHMNGGSYLVVQGFNGSQWVDFSNRSITNKAFDDWYLMDYASLIEEQYQYFGDRYSRIRIYSNTWEDGDELFMSDFKMTNNAPMEKIDVVKELPLTVNSYTFTNLDETYDYYVRVRSTNSATGIKSEWSNYAMAMGVATPVTLPATDIDDRGAFTANWMPVTKATYYEVDCLKATAIEADDDAYVILDEDFSKAVTSKSMINTGGLESLDDYCDNVGWTGYFNATEPSAIGTTYYQSMVQGYILSPEIDLDHNGGLCTVTVVAKGWSGDYVDVYNKAGVGFRLPMSENYEEYVFDITDCGDRDFLTFVSESAMDFFIDKVKVTTVVKQGEEVLSTVQKALTEETSYRFSQLDNDENIRYAYDVYACYVKDGKAAWSGKSERVYVDLNGPAVDPLGLTFDPENGCVVDHLKTINVRGTATSLAGIGLGYDFMDYLSYGEPAAKTLDVTDTEGNRVAGCFAELPDDMYDMLAYKLTLTDEITAPGTYTIELPEGFFIGFDSGYNDVNGIAMTLTYTIGGPSDSSLANTIWKSTVDQSMSYGDYSYQIHTNYTLNFVDETNGSMLIQTVMTMDGTELSSSENTNVFTYTFDGVNGVMYPVQNDEGYEIVPTPFTYDETDDSIHILVDMGTGEQLDVVFHRDSGIGIRTTTRSFNPGQTFDLQGRPMTGSAKGIVIQGGCKVLVR